MLTATALVMLHAMPGPVAEGTPRSARLIADAPVAKDYAQMTRDEQEAIYASLEERRPGLALPLVLIFAGGAGAVITAIAFWIPFSTVYGLAVYSAAILVTAFVVSLAMVGTGVALYAVRKPERDELGNEMQIIEQHYRDGRCRSVPGFRPCRNDPNGPVLPSRPGWVPQVRAPGPEPSLLLATF